MERLGSMTVDWEVSGSIPTLGGSSPAGPSTRVLISHTLVPTHKPLPNAQLGRWIAACGLYRLFNDDETHGHH